MDAGASGGEDGDHDERHRERARHRPARREPHQHEPGEQDRQHLGGVGGEAVDGREADLEHDPGEHRLRDRGRDRGDQRPEPRPQPGQHDQRPTITKAPTAAGQPPWTAPALASTAAPGVDQAIVIGIRWRQAQQQRGHPDREAQHEQPRGRLGWGSRRPRAAPPARPRTSSCSRRSQSRTPPRSAAGTPPRFHIQNTTRRVLFVEPFGYRPAATMDAIAGLVGERLREAPARARALARRPGRSRRRRQGVAVGDRERDAQPDARHPVRARRSARRTAGDAARRADRRRGRLGGGPRRSCSTSPRTRRRRSRSTGCGSTPAPGATRARTDRG